mgnify:CR=1 FL=1
MKDIQKIMVRTEQNVEVEANVVTFLKDNETGKEYVLYTVDESGDDVEIYASIFKQGDSGYELLPIESDEEWKLIQEELAKLAE